jgi:hypothetical protein
LIPPEAAAFKDSNVRRIGFLILIAAALAFHAPQSAAQNQARINITLEQQHVIRELLKDLRIEPSKLPAQPAVGDELPPDVNPQSMPSEIGLKVPQIKAHRLLLTADAIVIVDPKDNRVAEVIDLKAH